MNQKITIEQTPGEMMAITLREYNCYSCVRRKVHGDKFCSTCAVGIALAAHASGEYTEVVTERMVDILHRFVMYKHSFDYTKTRESVSVNVDEEARELLAYLQAKDGD